MQHGLKLTWFRPSGFAEDLNFRLKPDAKVVDAGVRLPTVNDDFAGKAPDLGALEAVQPEPHYGPRQEGKKPFYR
jgi:hypothetical protein